jgi:hypothetical protein
MRTSNSTIYSCENLKSYNYQHHNVHLWEPQILQSTAVRTSSPTIYSCENLKSYNLQLWEPQILHLSGYPERLRGLDYNYIRTCDASFSFWSHTHTSQSNRGEQVEAGGTDKSVGYQSTGVRVQTAEVRGLTYTSTEILQADTYAS